MPDITMCNGKGCELASTCYRYKAEPSKYMQAYFVESPIEDEQCDYYWEVKDCKHKFHSVYYGSEWEIECKKCDKNIYEIYSQEDANEIINNDLLKK